MSRGQGRHNEAAQPAGLPVGRCGTGTCEGWHAGAAGGASSAHMAADGCQVPASQCQGRQLKGEVQVHACLRGTAGEGTVGGSGAGRLTSGVKLACMQCAWLRCPAQQSTSGQVGHTQHMASSAPNPSSISEPRWTVALTLKPKAVMQRLSAPVSRQKVIHCCRRSRFSCGCRGMRQGGRSQSDGQQDSGPMQQVPRVLPIHSCGRPTAGAANQLAGWRLLDWAVAAQLGSSCNSLPPGRCAWPPW